ncbi:hypothetical protein KY389_10370 [Paracoccus bogoriensis]|nr:hypothetical protein [Paracoccus bogoriensis]
MPKLIPLALSGILLASPSLAQTWALGGHDPVGTLQAGQAVPGRSDIATLWKGELWHFSSEENRARFEADPWAFAPALDGYCPVALSEGRRERGDPRHFAVIGGNLYLLSSASAERRLREAPAEIIARARAAWDGN